MTDRSLPVVADGSPKGRPEKPYIVRPETDAFLGRLEGTLREDGARLFHVWGVGGVGKSTVLLKAREKLAGRVLAAEVSFGVTDGIEGPIGLMEALAKQLPNGGWGSDFGELIKLYRETLRELKDQPIEKGMTEEQKKSGLQLLLNIGLGVAKNFLSDDTAKDVDELKGKIVDGSTTGLLAVDAWMKQHRATKKDKQLRELLLDPEPRLTEAFARSLRGYGQPVLLVLDTYEKATQEIDIWLWRSLLGNQDVGAEGLGNTRILVAGRNCLTEEREGWRKLEQDRGCVEVLGLDRFDLLQTQKYLQDYCGITDDAKIEQIYGATKGLPYYLNWIRKEVQAGKDLDFSRGNDAIVDLLLQGLTKEQRRLIEIAACFRRFKKKTLERVLAKLKTEHDCDVAAAAGEQGAFEWLIDREKMQFVEKRDGHHRLDDVARDVFRVSLFEEDEDLFRIVQGVIAADYLAESQRVELEDAGYRVRYENVDWRRPRAAYLYHLLLSGDKSAELVFRSHLLEARYFRVDQLVHNPLRDLVGEFGLEAHPFLRDKLRRFLVTLLPAVVLGWEVLEEFPVNYTYNEEKFQIGKAEIDSAFQVCLAKSDLLTGLARFAALIYQSGRCLESRRLDYLSQAEELVLELIDPEDDDFSSKLYSWTLGSRFFIYKYREEAIEKFDKALKIKFDEFEDWYFRGLLLEISRGSEEAISSYDKALEIKPDYQAAWYSRGNSLRSLGRFEEAIASYDKAIEVKPDYHDAWFGLGKSLNDLGRFEEAIASYDNAIEVKPDDHLAWYNRGISLKELGRYEEAIASYDKAIEVNPDDVETIANRGDTHKTLGNHNAALIDFDRAIELSPDYAWAIVNRGDTHRTLGNHDAALIDFDRAIELSPDYAWAIASRGQTYAQLQQYEMALKDIDRAIELDPDLSWAIGYRGFLYLVLGRHNEALEIFHNILQQSPDSDNAHVGLAFTRRIIDPASQSWLTEIAQAIRLAQTNLEKDPTDWNNHFNLALYHLAANQHPEATALYQTGLNTAPTWALRMAHGDLLHYLHLFPNDTEAQHWSQQLGQHE